MSDVFITEFAWVIEKSERDYISGPLYYAMSHNDGEEEYWTTDPYKAVRFARQQDAEGMIRGFKITNASAVGRGFDNRYRPL